VRLMAPEYVRPYVKAQKTDDQEVDAIVEAATGRRCRGDGVDTNSAHRDDSRNCVLRLPQSTCERLLHGARMFARVSPTIANNSVLTRADPY